MISNPGENSAQADAFERVVQADGLANLTLQFDGMNEAESTGVLAVSAGTSSVGSEVGVTDTNRTSFSPLSSSR